MTQENRLNRLEKISLALGFGGVLLGIGVAFYGSNLPYKEPGIRNSQYQGIHPGKVALEGLGISALSLGLIGKVAYNSNRDNKVW